MEGKKKNQIKLARPMWIGISVISIIVFLIAFFLDNSYGRDRGSILLPLFYALCIALIFFVSVSCLLGRREYAEPTPWYRQSIKVMGLGFTAFFFSTILQILGRNNLIPDAPFFLMYIIVFVLTMFCLVWSGILFRKENIRIREGSTL